MQKLNVTRIKLPDLFISSFWPSQLIAMLAALYLTPVSHCGLVGHLAEFLVELRKFVICLVLVNIAIITISPYIIWMISLTCMDIWRKIPKDNDKISFGSRSQSNSSSDVWWLQKICIIAYPIRAPHITITITNFPFTIPRTNYKQVTNYKLQITISNLKNYIAKMSLYIEDIFDSKSVPKRTGVDVSPEICNTISQKRGYTGCLELYIGLPF